MFSFFKKIIPLHESGFATATTPDMIIAAHIVESYARDPQNWEFVDVTNVDGRRRIKAKDGSVEFNWESEQRYAYVSSITGEFLPDRLVKKIKDCTDYRQQQRLIKQYSAEHKFGAKIIYSRTVVNQQPIDPEAGRYIHEKVLELFKAHENAKAAARAAKAQMALEDKKWDLAEKLTGLKRDENGALRPVIQVEHDDETS